MSAMGAIERAVNYLRDPCLVRAVQECLGVKQIVSEADKDPCETKAVVANGSVANGVNWLATKVKSRKRLKHPGSSPHPLSSDQNVRTQLPDIVVETIPLFDIFFRLATELGYETFYITFFPFLMWNVDVPMARHAIVLWIGSMYLGQASKALFKWRRPSSPPAIRLEHNPDLETEYGFPSTHAIVSTTVPFYCAYYMFSHYNVCV